MCGQRRDKGDVKHAILDSFEKCESIISHLIAFYDEFRVRTPIVVSRHEPWPALLRAHSFKLCTCARGARLLSSECRTKLQRSMQDCLLASRFCGEAIY
jgi:hypothetical protein